MVTKHRSGLIDSTHLYGVVFRDNLLLGFDLRRVLKLLLLLGGIFNPNCRLKERTNFSLFFVDFVSA